MTYDEANEMTMREIIDKERFQNQDKENIEYINKIEKDFSKFMSSWNKFAGLLIRDQNVEI